MAFRCIEMDVPAVILGFVVLGGEVMSCPCTLATGWCQVKGKKEPTIIYEARATQGT